MVEQHRAVAPSGVEIARPEGDRACRLTQHAAKGQGLPDGAPFLDIALDNPERLFRKSLQPQDARLEIVRRYPHLEPHADDLGLLRQSRKPGERTVDMMASLLLIAEVMQRRGEETIGHHQIDSVAGLLRQSGE